MLGGTLRILFTNHHLAETAGSEMVTSELATSLKDSGHEVAVFTFNKGEFAYQSIEVCGVPVFTTNQSDCEAMARFNPEVIHIQHWPTFLWLRKIGIKAPVVFGFLGVVPAIENPPPLIEESQILSWAVSEEVRNNVASLPGWGNQEISIIRNWVPPELLQESPAYANHSEEIKKRIIVVSNHFPKEYMDLLGKVCAEMNLDLVHFGLPDNPKKLKSSDFKNAFAVVTVGRTALLSASLGIPTIILDHFGSDGWLTPENIFTVRERNFSGRTNALTPNHLYIRQLLSSPPTKIQVSELRRIVLDEHRIAIAVDTLQAIYKRAIQTCWEPKFGRGVDYFSELFESNLSIGRHNDSLVTERNALLAERSEIYNSNSWRVTRPFRLISAALQGNKKLPPRK
jgi:hypothetical protein